MDKRKWHTRLAAGALAAVTLAGAALAAGSQGTQNDPLVTLSYLTDKATPAILSQVDAKLTQREDELTAKLKAALGGGAAGATSAAYRVVTLTQGQQLIGKEGCEFLLRAGTATCVSDSSPGLVDMTAGSTLAPGGALVQNHLYLGTIDGRGIKAASAVTVMVRGAYTLG